MPILSWFNISYFHLLDICMKLWSLRNRYIDCAKSECVLTFVSRYFYIWFEQISIKITFIRVFGGVMCVKRQSEYVISWSLIFIDGGVSVSNYQYCTSGVRVARSLVFCVVFCRSLFVFLYFFLPIELSVLLWFTDTVSSNFSCHICLTQVMHHTRTSTTCRGLHRDTAKTYV